MTRMPERRPSVIVSDEIAPSPAPAICRVLPLRPAAHFDALEAQFFRDGDDLPQTDVIDGWTEWRPERSSGGGWRRGLRWALPVAALALGGALAVRHLARAQAVAAVVEVHRAAAPTAPPPAPALAAPAPAPAAPALAPLPIPSPPTAGTALPDAPAAAATDRVADCKAAHRKHRRREALAACTEAAAQHPDVAELAAMLAQHEFELGHAQRALTWAGKAIALDERHAEAYVFLGGAEQALGRGAAARTAYLRYLALAPRGRYAADLRAVLASLR